MAGYPQEQLGDTGTQYKVTHKTPDIVPVLRYAKVPATRRKAYLSYENRTASNAKLFKEILEVSQEMRESQQLFTGQALAQQLTGSSVTFFFLTASQGGC